MALLSSSCGTDDGRARVASEDFCSNGGRNRLCCQWHYFVVCCIILLLLLSVALTLSDLVVSGTLLLS